MNPITQNPKTRLPSNTFDLTHDVKLSTNFARLTPILTMDVLPGDTINIDPNVFIRFAPMIAPVMHRIKVYTHFFFVPNRILWPNWETFITGGTDGDQIQNPVPPYLEYSLNDQPLSSLFDYLGLPCIGDSTDNVDVRCSAFPPAAYQKIYAEYYRDQNLIDDDTEPLNDGDNSDKDFLYDYWNRAWQHDYFTSALPWAQKGPEAMLPLGSMAPVQAFNYTNPNSNDNAQMFRSLLTTDPSTDQNVESGNTGNIQTGDTDPAYIDLLDSHFANLSEATSSSIIEVRRAFALQQYLELNARSGTRYTEWLEAQFGVHSQDSRLQRPEFIGGSSTPVKISEVLQTSNNDTQTTPQGNMAGHGLAVGGSKRLSYSAKEHGYIIGIMSVMPMTAYQQGIPRHYLRTDRFDYYTPSFAHIGDQAIFQKELYVTNANHAVPKEFGYVPRYSEYKFMNNRVSGDFKQSLDFWHLGRKFGAAPELNKAFIEAEQSEMERIFAVQDGSDTLWCHILLDISARRLMPVFGTPKLI